MSIKHTPGPWKLKKINKDEFGLFKFEPGIGLKFGTVISPNLDAGSKFQEANTRLIAAAPELLEALKDALVLLDEYSIPRGVDLPSVIIRTAKMRSAIAKAEGGGE